MSDDEHAYVKEINAEDAVCALGDAIADLMHVYVAAGFAKDTHEKLLGVDLANAIPQAVSHHEGEQAGEDGVKIVVHGTHPYLPEPS